MAAFFSGARHLPAPASLHVATLAVQSALLSMLLASASASASALALALAQTADAPAAAELSEILVKAARDDGGASASANTVVINAAQLSRNNASDMANIARYMPLVSVPAAASGSGNIWDGAGNTGFNLRGAEGNRVSLALDGIALPDAAPKPDASAANAFGIGRDYFDPETFREVRISAGAGASAAGAASPGIGGAVSFITKAPEDYLSGRALYGDYKRAYSAEQAQRSHAVTAAAQLGQQVQGLIVAVHRHGQQSSSRGSVAPNPDDWRSDAVLAKLSWKVDARQRLVFTVDHFQAEHARVFSNKLSTAYPEGARQNGRTERNRYSLEHHYTPAAGLLFDSLDTRLYTQHAAVTDLTRASYLSGGQPYLRQISTGYYNNSAGLALDAGKQLAPQWQLAYGVSYAQQESRRPWLEDRTVLKTGAHQITMKNRMADMDSDQLAAYLRSEWRFPLGGLAATLTPGLRAGQHKLSPKNLQAYLIAVPNAANEIKQETESYLSPGVELLVELIPGYSGYASYSRATRLPTAAERTGTFDSFSYTAAGNGYAVLGNAQLGKETSHSFELGLKATPSPGLELDSTVFTTRYDNLIEYAAQPPDPVTYPTITAGLFRPENIGLASTWGGEVSARLQLGQWQPALKGYSVALAAGMARGTAHNRLSGKRADLPSIQPYKANATLAYDDAAGRGGLALTVSGARAKTAAEDVISNNATARFAVPAYSVLDCTAYWNIGQHAVLNAGVYNLGDRKYWDYAAARSLAAGSTPLALAEIERAARPGRNYAINLKVIY